MKPHFIDFEASSLSWHSYPIEVAWNMENGNIESCLISPKHVPEWTDWDPEAQKLHGITRSEILAQGESPSRVCEKIEQALSGKRVYSDNPDFDSMWMMRLFDAVGKSYPNINMLHLDSLLIDTLCPDTSGRIEGFVEILKLKSLTRACMPIQHRAGWDVRYLTELWESVKGAHSQKVGNF
ncbi:hypothetical protein QUF80_07105 [Desulfococcaceae bacterium HSG8]|nr:hypothetical protein [Desulfococcaceae bacterium HSG8]